MIGFPYGIWLRLFAGRQGEYHRTWQDLIRGCESPIEEQLAEALREATVDRKIDLRVADREAPRAFLLDRLDAGSLWIMGQRSIGRYRADFVLVGRGEFGEVVALVVECDGREWHTTEEQVKRDHKRDAELNAMRLRVERFDGATITHAPERCAATILKNFSCYLATKPPSFEEPSDDDDPEE